MFYRRNVNIQLQNENQNDFHPQTIITVYGQNQCLILRNITEENYDFSNIFKKKILKQHATHAKDKNAMFT